MKQKIINFFIVVCIIPSIIACHKDNSPEYSIPTEKSDSYTFLSTTRYFDAESTRKYISFIGDNKLLISSDLSSEKVPQAGDCIFCDRGNLVNSFIGKVISVSGTKVSGDYLIEVTDVSVEEVFEEIHIVQDFDLASVISGAEDEEGNPISYVKASPKIWDALTATQLDSVQRDTSTVNAVGTKVGDTQSTINPLSFALNNDCFTGKLYGEVVFHPEIHYTKSTGLLYRMSWEQRFGFEGDLHFKVKGEGEKSFGAIKIPLGQVCGIFTMLKLEPALFWEGEHGVKCDLKIEIDHSEHIVTNGSGEVQHICKPLKKETVFSVSSLETEGKFGLKMNVEVNAAVFHEKILSMGIKACRYVGVKANINHFSINLPEILSMEATADILGGIRADGYVTWMTPTGTKTKTLELADIEIKVFAVNLLPKIDLMSVLKGNVAKIESKAARQSFIESPKGGISVWKGKDTPEVIRHSEIYTSPSSTKASEISGDLEFELESDEVYYIAPYAEVDGQIIYGRKEELQVDLCPEGSHVHAIDLGLSVKWACCNVGATRPEEYGGLYAWGETSEKSVYIEVTYSFAHGTDTDGDGLYENNCTYDFIGSDISDTQYDVAHVRWGGKWRMPSNAEFEELISNCTSTWTTINGVNGMLFTSRENGNSIFLPAAGCGISIGIGPDSAGSGGLYWSSTFDSDGFACNLFFTSDHVTMLGDYRFDGLSVRPVSE